MFAPTALVGVGDGLACAWAPDDAGDAVEPADGPLAVSLWCVRVTWLAGLAWLPWPATPFTVQAKTAKIPMPRPATTALRRQ